MIEVRKLVKRYGQKVVLKGLDLTVEEGQFVALLGPNGAGKTTLMRILATLAKPQLGEVWIAGMAIPAEAGKVRSRLGVVGHQPMLYGDLTGEENLRFFARLYALPDPVARIHEVLELIGLDRARRELVRRYSRGMQQRLSIGRAILHRPTVLLLDEPYTGLDPEASNTLDQLLSEVIGKGRTVLMASHQIERAAALADRIDILARGKILESVQSEEIDVALIRKRYQEVVRV